MNFIDACLLGQWERPSDQPLVVFISVEIDYLMVGFLY